MEAGGWGHRTARTTDRFGVRVQLAYALVLRIDGGLGSQARRAAGFSVRLPATSRPAPPEAPVLLAGAHERRDQFLQSDGTACRGLGRGSDNPALGRTRSCHVAGCESAQACSRRGLRRQLPGLRGSSRAPLLPVLDSSRLTKSRGARLDRRVGATALRARLASTGRVPLLAPLNESDAAVCGGFGDPAVAHERRPRSRDPQPATLNPELRRVEGWVGPRPGCRQRITGRLSVAGFMRSVGVSTSFSQG